MEALAASKEAAHKAASDAYAEAKRLVAEGKQAVISAKEYDADRSLEQNRYYWGPLLGTISEQVRTPDRWTAEAWHQLFRRQFLGYEVKREVVAGKKRPVTIRRLRSTRDLTVKQFATYLEQITAYATTELGVEFPA